MEDTKTYITDITTNILDNYFPQIDSLSQLITPDPIRATRIIVNRIQRILDNFELYCPLTAIAQVSVDGSGCHTFIDNYKDVVEGKELKENLELVPLTIARVGGKHFTTMPSVANYWSYSRPTLKCYARNSIVNVKAIYHYPIYISYTEDGYLHKDSHIYGLDVKQKNMLYNIMELEFLTFIKGNAERVKLPLGIDFFNLNDDIQKLETRVDNDKETCSAAIIAWY